MLYYSCKSPAYKGNIIASLDGVWNIDSIKVLDVHLNAMEYEYTHFRFEADGRKCRFPNSYPVPGIEEGYWSVKKAKDEQFFLTINYKSKYTVKYRVKRLWTGKEGYRIILQKDHTTIYATKWIEFKRYQRVIIED